MDGALPFSLVSLLGVDPHTMPWLRRPFVRAGVVMGIGIVVEASQAMGIPLFGRTADPLDLLMYAAGALAAVGFEYKYLPR